MRLSRTLRIAAMLAASGAHAGPAPENPGPTDTPFESRQARDDAWWTGPLLAASPGALPHGHFLIEPYVFDVIPRGHYDEHGTSRPVPHENNFGSQSFILYGLTDRVSVGLLPRFGYNLPSEGVGSSGPGMGDLGLQAQYNLTQFREGGWIPTTAFVFGETLPTGKYDRLGKRPADGLGAGAYTSTLSLYSQYFFWMPNGRILRTRLDLSYSLSDPANVHDVSVYGTPQGFAGRAHPGNTFLADAAFEYSVTRNWVLAMDVVYEYDADTRVRGLAASASGAFIPVELHSGAGRSVSLAPAIEYNFNSRVGVIAGAKLSVAGRNSTDLIIPVAAINIVI